MNPDFCGGMVDCYEGYWEMKVYIANFGEQNYAWPDCLKRGTIATMNTVDVQPLWQAGDRESYIAKRMDHLTAAGHVPTKAVSSRWFNLMTTISETEGDVWIHSDTQYLWWTRSLSEECTFEELVEPVGRKREVVICHKPCTPWSRKDAKGAHLPWAGLHPKAKDFLSTESTMQRLSPDNAAYALALISGDDLNDWHERPEWKKKVSMSASKSGAAKTYNHEEIAAFRMAETAFRTAAAANGQIVEKASKIKNMAFGTRKELEQYILELLIDQERRCALTNIPLNMDEREGEPELRASLDRIDSSGDYALGNLQIVCKFANRWKGAGEDDDFRRVISIVRQHS